MNPTDFRRNLNDKTMQRYRVSMPIKRSSREGLTALELLVASSLAAVLMVSFLGLVGHLSKRHNSLTENREQLVWRDSFASRVQRDFENSHTIHISPHSFLLDGVSMRDSTTDVPLHRAARVVYRIERTSRGTVLIRDLIDPTSPEITPIQSNLVAEGATEFEFQSYDDHKKRWTRESWRSSGYKKIDIAQPLRLRIVGFDQQAESILVDTMLVRAGVAP